MNESEIKTRLNRIEAKIDKFALQANSNRNDINWLKGSVRIALTFAITIAGAGLSLLVKLIN